MQKPHCHQVWAAAELAMFGAACCNVPGSLEPGPAGRSASPCSWSILPCSGSISPGSGLGRTFQGALPCSRSALLRSGSALPCSWARRHVPGCVAGASPHHHKHSKARCHVPGTRITKQSNLSQLMHRLIVLFCHTAVDI